MKCVAIFGIVAFISMTATAIEDVDNYGSFAFDWIDTNSDGNITRAEFDVVANLVEEMLDASFDSYGDIDCNEIMSSIMDAFGSYGGSYGTGYPGTGSFTGTGYSGTGS